LGAIAAFNWAAWIVFVLVAAVTPGPNNTMLLNSGGRFGVRRSLPHLVGVCLGFALMFSATAAGLGALVVNVPASQIALKVLALVVFVWLAYSMATAPFAPLGGEPRHSNQSRPMTFAAAAAFQWINPKAWVACVGASAAYLGPTPTWQLIGALAASFAVLSAPCALIWLALGAVLRRWLGTPRRQRVFNVTMALLLLSSLVTVLR
jgi:threonine/homoserine/homoserine lactone efflux protein